MYLTPNHKIVHGIQGGSLPIMTVKPTIKYVNTEDQSIYVLQWHSKVNNLCKQVYLYTQQEFKNSFFCNVDILKEPKI